MRGKMFALRSNRNRAAARSCRWTDELLSVMRLSILLLAVVTGDVAAQATDSVDCDAGNTYKVTPKLVRGPFLQQVTRDSIVVRWDTSKPATSVVYYRLQGTTLDRSVCDFAPTEHHEVRLSGLTAGEYYDYAVRSNGVQAPAFSFRAAAAAEQPFSFVVYGDNQANPDIHATVASAALATGPDFFLNTGDSVPSADHVHNFDKYLFEPAFELLANTPFFVSIGNHEAENLNYFDMLSLPGNEHWYGVTYGNARILALDTNLDYSGGSDQYVWLESELKSARSNGAEWLIVFNHKPAWCEGWGWAGYDGEVSERTTLVPLFEKYGVDLVFNGHAHDYEHAQLNGVTYVIAGGGGGDLDSFQNTFGWFSVYEAAHHFVHVAVDGKTLHAQAITPDRSIIDDFFLTH